MDKYYKVGCIIYNLGLIISLTLCLLLCIFIGQRSELRITHYLILIQIIASLIFFNILTSVQPKNRNLFKSIKVINILLLGISFISAISTLITVYFLALDIEFIILVTLAITVFCMSIVIIIKQLIKKQETTANSGLKKLGF